MFLLLLEILASAFCTMFGKEDNFRRACFPNLLCFTLLSSSMLVMTHIQMFAKTFHKKLEKKSRYSAWAWASELQMFYDFIQLRVVHLPSQSVCWPIPGLELPFAIISKVHHCHDYR